MPPPSFILIYYYWGKFNGRIHKHNGMGTEWVEASLEYCLIFDGLDQICSGVHINILSQ